MESNADVSRLLELMFGKKPTISDETVADSCISNSLLTEDFSKKLAFVFKVNKRIVSLHWPNFFDRHWSKMFSSSTSYEVSVIYLCVLEHESLQNAFERFISVCALVMHLSEETLEKTGVDFRDLNPDIIMIYYLNVYKRSFPEKTGIEPFVEYICGHKYLTWWNKNDLALSDEPTSSVFFELDLNEEIQNELNRYLPLQGEPNEISTRIELKTAWLVDKLRRKTSFKYPTLPSENELIKRLVAYRIKENAKKAGGKSHDETALTNAISDGNSILNSDSKTDYLAEQQEDIEWYENIVQTVIKYNQSNNLGHESANSQSHEKAEGILDNLKDNINSLIDVLDKCEIE